MATETKPKQNSVSPGEAGYRHTVSLRYLHMAPRKVRLVASMLKDLSLNEAEAHLLMLPNRPSEPLLKLLKSAMANIKNAGKDPNRIVIESIRVDQGPMIKRYLPRAHGRATPIQKKMSHVTVTVQEVTTSDSARFVIAPRVKDKKVKKEKKVVTPKQEKHGATGGEKQAKKSGFLKKMFQRKSG
jgi:large subunit ribosomal protein L22